jgi:hypothetical protein
MLDVDAATIRKWEAGKGRPMEWRAYELMLLLGHLEAASLGQRGAAGRSS